MIDILYFFFIAPLEYLMDLVLHWGYSCTGSYGFALIVMSLVVNTVILPIYNKADGWQDEERALKKRMEPRETMIRSVFTGQERFAMTATLYRQFGYSSLMTLRASVGFLLQVPFFFAAYHLLSGMKVLHGQAFGPLADLGSADGLLVIGDITINVMPLLMTAINFISAFIYTKTLSRRDKIQLYGIAALFLILLYDSPVALTFYWTLNNVYSLGKNIVEKDLLPRLHQFLDARRSRQTSIPPAHPTSVCEGPFPRTAVPPILHAVRQYLHALHWFNQTNAFAKACLITLPPAVVCWLIVCKRIFAKNSALPASRLICEALPSISVQIGLCALFALLTMFFIGTRRAENKLDSHPCWALALTVLLYVSQLKFFTWSATFAGGYIHCDPWDWQGWVYALVWISAIWIIQRYWETWTYLLSKIRGYITHLHASDSIPSPYYPWGTHQGWGSPGITAALCTLLPILLVWERNSHMFPAEDLTVSAGVLLWLSLAVYALANLVAALLSKRRKKSWWEWAGLSLFCVLLVAEIFFWGDVSLLKNVQRLTSRILLFALFAGAFFWALRSLTGSLCNKMLAILTFCLAISIGINKYQEYCINTASHTYTAFQYDLADKPDIFLFFMESYIPTQSMKNVYGIDVQPFQSHLHHHGFIEYPDVFSNGDSTLTSLFRTYSMEMVGEHLQRGNLDGPGLFRTVNGGGQGNMLFEYLKKQGYTIELYYQEGEGLAFGKGRNLDYFYEEDGTSQIPLLVKYTEKPLLNMNSRLATAVKAKWQSRYASLPEFVSTRLAQPNRKQPLFLVGKGGPTHAPTNGYSWSRGHEWKNTGVYQAKVKQGNEEIMHVCDMIISHNPNALIILLGDHGPMNFMHIDRGCPADGPGMRSYFDSCGAGYENVIRDKFHVMCAVRMPSGHQDIRHGRSLVPVNLFRHIFATLNNAPQQLKSCVESYSTINDVKVIKNGCIQLFQ